MIPLREKLVKQDEPLYDNWKRKKQQINPLSLIKPKQNIPIRKFQPSPNILLDKPTEKSKQIQKNIKLKSRINNKEKSFKTKMCHEGRNCRKRFTCKYAHSELELRKPYIKRTKQCLLYQRGMCSLGSSCRQYHGNIDLKNNYKYKEEFCKDYLNGVCHKGILCIHKHEKQEDEQIANQLQIQQQQDLIKQNQQMEVAPQQQVPEKQINAKKNSQFQEIIFKNKQQSNRVIQTVQQLILTEPKVDINDMFITFQ